MSEQPGVGVVAAGAWGTALAKLLAEKGVPTRIWAHEPEVVASINTERENAVFLAGVRLPESLRAYVPLFLRN